MIKLICDWCEKNIPLIFDGDRNYGSLTVYIPETISLIRSKWHVDGLVRDGLKIQVDLCPECKTLADTEKDIAQKEAAEIMKAAVKKANTAKKKLIADAHESAKQQRTIRIERDTEMRRKERQRITDA